MHVIVAAVVGYSGADIKRTRFDSGIVASVHWTPSGRGQARHKH